MIHFVCYPKKKIETFVDVAKIKIPKNNKEAIDIFKNKINDSHNKFKGENIIKLNKNGKLIITYQKNLILMKQKKDLESKLEKVNSSQARAASTGSSKRESKQTSSKSRKSRKNRKSKEKFENLIESESEEEKINLLPESELLDIKQKITIPKNKIPILFSKAIQHLGSIGSVDIIKYYDLIYKTFYYNDVADGFDKDAFISNFLDITTNIENRLTNGLEALTDIGFNYLNISPILTPDDYDSSGNYVYKSIEI